MGTPEPHMEVTISPWPPTDPEIMDSLREEIDRLVSIGHVRVEPLEGVLRVSTFTADVAAEMAAEHGLPRVAADLHLHVTTRSYS